MSLYINSALVGASVQDDGRPGLQRYGVTSGGAVDKLALAQGRVLLNDEGNTAALEFSAVGGKFKVQTSSFFVFTGAEAPLKLNGNLIQQGQVFEAKAGDEIEIGSISNGFYGYLHVAGGFLSTSHLGSRSTNFQVGLGETLEIGNILPYKSTSYRDLKLLKLNDYFDSSKIRVVAGPQTNLFSEKVLQRFFSTEFKVSPMRNRMGVKLTFNGENFYTDEGLSVLSDAIELGDIQIDGEGTPTVLLNDRQPTGGYPRISTIISADLHKFAQKSVASKFNFVLVSLREAVNALEVLSEQLGNLRSQVASVQRDPHNISNLLNYSLVGGAIRGDEFDES